jgi:hypothetical protein
MIVMIEDALVSAAFVLFCRIYTGTIRESIDEFFLCSRFNVLDCLLNLDILFLVSDLSLMYTGTTNICLRDAKSFLLVQWLYRCTTPRIKKQNTLFTLISVPTANVARRGD